MDHKTLDKIIEALAGKNHDGTPSTGLIPAMQQGTARRKILDAFATPPSEQNDIRKSTP